MRDPGQHEVAACARAWQMLRLAHDRVAGRLGATLAAECALALNEFDVLLHLRLRPNDEVRIGALLEAVPLSQPALSRLVGRLEERGLVARSKGADDARATIVCLTETGTALIDRAIEVHARVVEETLTGRFSAAERAGLLETLSRIGGSSEPSWTKRRDDDGLSRPLRPGIPCVPTTDAARGRARYPEFPDARTFDADRRPARSGIARSVGRAYGAWKGRTHD